jgi:hypothetical protein
VVGSTRADPVRGGEATLVDLDRLTLGERLVGVGAAVLVAASPLQWLGGSITKITLSSRSIPVNSYHFTHNAWGYGVTVLAVLIGIGLLLYIALLPLDLPALAHFSPRSVARPVAAFGVLTFVLVLLKVAVGANVGLATFGLPSTSGVAISISFTKTRQVGAYLGLVASAAIAAGGILNLREASAA